MMNHYHSLLPGSRMIKVYNGISYRDYTREINVPTGILQVCISGIVAKQKNQKDAVEAMNILVNEKMITSFQLHIIGSEKEEYGRELREYIKEHHLNDFVQFHGHQANTNIFLQKVNLGLMCSEGEPFGRVSIEFMRFKIPVIASNSGANPEIIKDGINGFLYELHNPGDLAEKMLYYIDRPDLITSMGESAYHYARENFSSEKNTMEIYNVIKDLIKN